MAVTSFGPSLATLVPVNTRRLMRQMLAFE